MKTIELRRRVALSPAQLLDRIAQEDTWLEDGTTVVIRSGRAAGIDLSTSTRIPADRLPAAAQRFLGEEAQLLQRVTADPTADDASSAALRIDAEVAGAPVEVRVDIRVASPDAQSSDLHAVTTISSSVPLLGGMIESAVEPYVESLLTKSLDKVADL